MMTDVGDPGTGEASRSRAWRPPSASARRPGWLLVMLGAVCLLLPLAVISAENEEPAAGSDQRPRSAASSGQSEEEGNSDEILVKTQHELERGDGASFSYEAAVGTLVLPKTDTYPSASLFFTSYHRTDGDGAGARPVMFCFNGGPGSSSVWLHLGAFGPKRVNLGSQDTPNPPPYGLIPNPHTVLDVTDLVFIDPVSTGFSRALPEEKRKAFHSVRADIHSVSRFIQLYATRFGRWDSPKYVAGESYGGLRAAGVAAYLHDEFGLDLNGVLFISPVLNFQTIAFDPGNDLPNVLFLPSYTAAAWYHGQLDPERQAMDLSAVLGESEAFASGPYRSLLFRGAEVEDEARQQAAETLAALTGLDADYISRGNLRMHPLRFSKELLRHERRTVGRFDARKTGYDRQAVGDLPEYDPSFHAVYGPFATSFNHYIRSELDFPGDMPYRTLASEAVHPWQYAPFENRYVNVTEDLRQAMSKNRHLRALIASGTYDLATPYFATAYTVRHLWVSPQRRAEIVLRRYAGGHMFYTDESELERFAADVRSFVTRAPGQR